MALAKSWDKVPAQSFTANGTAGGLVTINSTLPFHVGQTVLLQTTNPAQDQDLIIKRIININQMILGPNDNNPKTYSNLSGYTTTLNATISAIEQPRASFSQHEYDRAIFAEEPIVANRSILVDQLGNYFSTSNPIPVQLSGGVVNIETVHNNLAVQLTAKDNDPNPGDVHDSVRVGDGIYELGMTAAGEAKTSDATAQGKLDVLHADLTTLDSDLNTRIGPITEVAPTTDTGSSGLNGRLQRVAQRLTTVDADLNSFSSQSHTDLLQVHTDLTTTNTELGPTTEVAPATDTGASGLNGRLQRVAQRLTTLDTDLNSFSTQSHSDLTILHNDNVTIEGKLDTVNTNLGPTNETAPTTDTGLSGLNGRLQRVAQRLTTIDADINTASNLNHNDQTTLHNDNVVIEGKLDTVNTNLTTTNTEIGPTTEVAPTTDTGTSGLNGRLQRIAQRLTTVDTDLNSFAAANHADLTAINNKLADGFGAPANALRTASQLGNANGAADFGAGATSAQTLRTATNLYDSQAQGLTSSQTIYPGGSPKRGLDVTLPTTPSWDTRVATTIKLVGDVVEATTLDLNLWNSTTAGSGSLILANNMMRLETGTTANSSVFVVSTKRARFILESTNAFKSGIRLDAGVANNLRRWGAYDSQNGVYFQLNGTTPGIGVRQTGVDTIVTTFNGPNPFVLDTNFHRYEIQYNQGDAYFYQDGKLIHVYSTLTGSLTDTAHYKIGMENTNSAGAIADVSMYARGATILRYGEASPKARYFHSNYYGRVQYTSSSLTANGNSLAATLPANSTQGNLLVAAVSVSGAALSTLSDNKGQTWTLATSLSNGNSGFIYIYYVANSVAGVNTLTATLGVGITSLIEIILAEYNGVVTTNALDKTSTNSVNAAAWNTGSVTTAQPIELLFAAVFNKNAGNDTMTPGSGFSSIAYPSSGTVSMYAEDEIVTSVGSYSGSGTNSANRNLYAALATFVMTPVQTALIPNYPTVVKYGPGTLRKIIINNPGTGNATATIYEGSGATKNVIAVLALTTSEVLDYDLDFDMGLSISVNSNSADFTVLYD